MIGTLTPAGQVETLRAALTGSVVVAYVPPIRVISGCVTRRLGRWRLVDMLSDHQPAAGVWAMREGLFDAILPTVAEVSPELDERAVLGVAATQGDFAAVALPGTLVPTYAPDGRTTGALRDLYASCERCVMRMRGVSYEHAHRGTSVARVGCCRHLTYDQILPERPKNGP